MISCSISRKRIDKSLLIPSKSGIAGEEYLSFILVPNRDGKKDQYGNDGFISQRGSKEQNEKMKKEGKYGPIIGNWQEFGNNQKPQEQKREYLDSKKNQETNPASDPLPELKDVPF